MPFLPEFHTDFWTGFRFRYRTVSFHGECGVYFTERIFPAGAYRNDVTAVFYTGLFKNLQTCHFMEKKFAPVNRITHKELRIIFGLSEKGARRRLTAIRASLGKKTNHVLTVVDFCKAEDISLKDFDLLMERATAKHG